MERDATGLGHQVLDARGAQERRLSRISHTSQGGAIEGNAGGGTDDALMLDQGMIFDLTRRSFLKDNKWFGKYETEG
jgi:hypothetical protein